MKTKLAPLKIGDRVRHYRTQGTGRVTHTAGTIAVDWSDGKGQTAGYTREELRKVPAMRCHCPDCDRSKGRKPCPLAPAPPTASRTVFGETACIAAVAHVMRNRHDVRAEYVGDGVYRLTVGACHADLLPIKNHDQD